MRAVFRAAIVPACAATLAVAAFDYASAGQRWWAHVRVLASDEMQGRQTGSQGYRKAAEYVAEQFRTAGLQPAGTEGWFQPVRFEVRRLLDSQSTLALVRNGQEQRAQLGTDAIVWPVQDVVSNLSAPMVFTGYGLHAAEAGYDDLAGLDLKGKVAVFVGGAPASMVGPVRAHYQAAAERWKGLRAAGAVGMISIPLPSAMDIPWERIALSRFEPRMFLADPAMNEMAGEEFAAIWNPARADELFAGTGRDSGELLAAAAAGKPLPKFPMGREIRAHIAVETSQAESPNVIAKVPGSDARLKSEYVVMSAHLDHLGTGQPINGDAIYNGAMDDASGIASLIEVARTLKNGEHLKRSVVFLAVCGEEKGELGSLWYAAHPTVPAADIVADVNVDMFLPLHPLHWLEVQGLNESTLGESVRAAAASQDVQVQGDKQPQRNLFIRSDQYSFVRHGVPALAFKFGYLPGSPEERLHREWLRVRYHAPSDDINQPVDLAGAARFDNVIARLIAQVANDPKRPQWYSSSFFKRFAAPQ